MDSMKRSVCAFGGFKRKNAVHYCENREDRIMNCRSVWKVLTVGYAIVFTSFSAVAAVSSAGAVIRLCGEPAVEDIFKPKAVLFTNRPCLVNECPASLEGMKFLRSSIDSTKFDVLEPGRLIILTPVDIPGAATQIRALEEKGFVRRDEAPFQLLGDKEIDRVVTYEKNVLAGESIHFEKYVVVMGFGEAKGVFKRGRGAEGKPYVVYPSDIPNTGILLVDQAKDNRSGHGGITLTECANGDILAFYSVTWAEAWGGHGCGGWSLYRRSTDGGQTWGDPVSFDYSKKMWNGGDVYSALVQSVLTAPDGTLVATVLRFSNMFWTKQDTPVYFLSHDNGHTWEGPKAFDPKATVEDISTTISTHFVHNGEIFIVFRGGRECISPGGPHSLWVSEDNGQSFHRRSFLPFEKTGYYWAANALDDGSIIVYCYEAFTKKEKDQPAAEKNIPYVVSRDGGRTWSERRTAFFAKGIRNLQMSDKLGDYYFMQGRSGSCDRPIEGDDPGPNNFVLYVSKDGVHWDEGVVLLSRLLTPGGGDCYSDCQVVGKYDPNRPERLLVYADVSYNGARTNMHYWWVNLAPTNSKKF